MANINTVDVTAGVPTAGTGTVFTLNYLSGTVNATLPSGAAAMGVSDGTNLQFARGFDADTGAGFQYILGAVERVPASGGSIAKTFGTGTRDAGTQRVTIATDDVVPASQSGTWNIGTVTTVSTVTNLSQLGGVAIAMNSGVRSTGTQRVTIATDDLVPVQDNASLVDNAAFTDGTTRVLMQGYIYDEVAGTALTENDAAAARINVNRSQIHIIEDGATRGRYVTVTASNELKVTGAVTVASGGIASGAVASGAIASGAVASGAFAAGSIAAGAVAAGASSFVKLEDAASADADAGVPAMAVRKATPANTSSTDGDYEMLQMSAGRLWTNTLLGDGTNAVAVKAASTSAAATDPSLVVQLSPQNMPFLDTSNFVYGVISSAMTGTTSTSLVAAPGASLRNYITTVIVSNSHATVGTDVLLQDGSGGTTLMVIPAAAAYGGATITLPTPLRQPTANTALYAANVTTGSSIKVSAYGYKAA